MDKELKKAYEEIGKIKSQRDYFIEKIRRLDTLLSERGNNEFGRGYLSVLLEYADEIKEEESK